MFEKFQHLARAYLKVNIPESSSFYTRGYVMGKLLAEARMKMTDDDCDEFDQGMEDAYRIYINKTTIN